LPALSLAAARVEPVLAHFLAIGGKRVGKGNNMLVLSAFPHLAEARVIAVLLAALRVPARGLDVAVNPRANPDVSPCRRDCQSPDPFQHVRLGELRPVCPAIRESFPAFFRCMPGRASETYLRPADSAASLGSAIACALSAKSTNTDKALHLPPQTNLFEPVPQGR
jgi:hypothetical protein